jgi:hypothetical protein
MTHGCQIAKTRTAGKKKPAATPTKKPPRLLKDIGIGPEEAAEIRISMLSFEEAWNAPGMEVYDDL